MAPVAKMEPSPASDLMLYNTNALEAPIHCRYYNSKVPQRLWAIAQVGQGGRIIAYAMCCKQRVICCKDAFLVADGTCRCLRESEQRNSCLEKLAVNLRLAFFHREVAVRIQEVESLRERARESFPYASHEAAIGHLNQALALYPDSPHLLNSRALFHLCNHDAAAAVRFLLDPSLSFLPCQCRGDPLIEIKSTSLAENLHTPESSQNLSDRGLL